MLFPSGVKVEIYRNDYGLNIIFQTPRSPGKERGICLYAGGIGDQDAIDKFANQSR